MGYRFFDASGFRPYSVKMDLQKSKARWQGKLVLGLKRKFSFLYFRENLFSLFAKKAYKKLQK
jgi:hypothetical protein